MSESKSKSKLPWVIGLGLIAVLGGVGIWLSQEEPADESTADDEVEKGDPSGSDTGSDATRSEVEEHMRSIGYVQ